MPDNESLVDALETVYARFIAAAASRGQAYTRCKLAEATVGNWRSEFFANNPKEPVAEKTAVGA
jgi:hypothetical protein